MKFSNVFAAMLVITFLCIFSGMFINISSSEDDRYILTITDKNYIFIKNEEVKGHVFQYYDITIVVKNSGNIISDDITVKIEGGDGLSEKLNYTIAANDSKGFVFSNFFIEKADQHRINISYFPTDLSVHERNEDNSGFTTLVFSTKTESEDSTPGFEFVLLVVAFIFYLIQRKKND